jgi:signal transduction histidine kinase
MYYFSRFKKQYVIPATGYCFATYGYLVFNYFHNAGITGPTIMGFVSSFILIVALGPASWYLLWIILHIVLVSGLIILEYFNVGSYDQYVTREDHFLDVGLSFIVCILYMYLVILYIRNNYLREKKLAEQYAASILAQNKELDELNQVKNRLFSIISHDLRTPLNSIQGYLEVLNSHSFSEEEKSKIQEQLLGLTRYTQDMLFNLITWSKSQLSGSTVELQVVNVHSMLAATMDMLQVVAGRKGIGLTSVIDAGLQAKANADMLQLVVRNMVHNAIKFTNAGGHITVEAHKRGEETLIMVRDNGIGIPLDKQAEIFSSKLKSAYGTNKEKGIGLGLYLCRELVELQGGHIGFTSTPGAGSSFFFALPAQ